jgi:hypothetical protein
MVLSSLLFWFGVVKGGDLVQVESFNNFEGFCILKTTLAFGVWVHFSSFVAIEGPCIAITYLWLVG